MKNNVSKFLLCRVALGEFIEMKSDKTIKRPPFKDQND